MKTKTKSLIAMLGGIVGSIAVINLSMVATAMVPGEVEIISKTYNNSQANNNVGTGVLSANGKVAVFSTYATNMLSQAGAGIFHKNLETGVITRVNVSDSGQIDNGQYHPQEISATGRYIVFSSNGTNLIDNSVIAPSPAQLYLRDVRDGTTRLVTQSIDGTASNGSFNGALGVSSDGRFVAFYSNASNLHPDSTNGSSHLYMLDTINQTLSILDRKPDGSLGYTTDLWRPNGGMSCDGSLIAFTYGGNLTAGPNSNHVDVYLLDRRAGDDKLTNLTHFFDKAAMGPRVSCNGDYIAFKSSATNVDANVSVVFDWTSVRPFVYDRIDESYHLAAVTHDGLAIQENSSCGTYNTSDSSQCVYVSDSGQALFKSSKAYVPGASGVQAYVRDIHKNVTSLVSINSSGVQANAAVGVNGISASGSSVLLGTIANNLTIGDTNNKSDFFTAKTGY